MTMQSTGGVGLAVEPPVVAEDIAPPATKTPGGRFRWSTVIGPLLTLVLIPLDQKEAFNTSQAQNDVLNWGRSSSPSC